MDCNNTSVPYDIRLKNIRNTLIISQSFSSSHVRVKSSLLVLILIIPIILGYNGGTTDQRSNRGTRMAFYLIYSQHNHNSVPEYIFHNDRKLSFTYHRGNDKVWQTGG